MLCALLILAITGFAADHLWDSTSTGKDSEGERLDIFLDLTPVQSQTLEKLDLSYLMVSESQQMAARPFVRPNMAAELGPNKNRHASPQISKLQNSLYTASLVTLTALNIGDYLSTRQALKHEELKEANPIMQPFAKNFYLFTAVKVGIAALDVYLLKNLYKKNKPLAWILSAAANFALSYVVANNIKMIQDVR